MISILISIIQHEQNYLTILIISLKAATLLKNRLWHKCFSVNFAKFLGPTFFIEHIWATARKNSVKQLV